MVAIMREGLTGFAWLGAAGVLLLSTFQMLRLLRRENRDGDGD